MNIYAVHWVRGGFGLCAVVIAASEASAIEELGLNQKYNNKIAARQIGACTDGTTEATVICEEDL